jgi:hypothetical protein
MGLFRSPAFYFESGKKYRLPIISGSFTIRYEKPNQKTPLCLVIWSSSIEQIIPGFG